MKIKILLTLLTAITTIVNAQTWSGTTLGNIYYNSGNVGIGTTNPVGKFQITDNHLDIFTSQGLSNSWTKDGLTISANPDVNYSSLRINSNHSSVSDRGVLNVTRSSSSLFYVRTDGNVGIGTTNPDMKLSIQASDQFIARFSSTGTQSITGLRMGGNSSYADLVNLSTGFGIGAGTASANLPLNSQSPNHVYFFLSSSSGNVGIGTITPSYKTVISNNGAAGIEIDPTGMQFSQGVGIQTYNRSTSTYLPFQIYSSKLVLDGGNVLIGKTTQVNSAYKLDVNGSMRSNEVVVNVTGADFVFQDNYNLKTLNEVERFIKDNKHLPDIEAAEEMEENGLELGKMDMKLLQKIEELTLYMIDFKKEMDKMKEENQKLKDKIIELEKE
jgi:hypothetical protein